MCNINGGDVLVDGISLSFFPTFSLGLSLSLYLSLILEYEPQKLCLAQKQKLMII